MSTLAFTLQKKNVEVAAAGVAAAFLGLSLYPAEQGFLPGSETQTLLLRAMMGLAFIFLLHRRFTLREDDFTDAGGSGSPLRRRRMLVLWSALTIFLAIPLFRFPLQDMAATQTVTLRSAFGLLSGITIAAFTTVHVIRAVRPCEK